MKVFFCTQDPGDKLDEALEAAGRRGDVVLTAEHILHQDPRFGRDYGAEIAKTIILIEAADIVVSFPDWRRDARCRMEIAHAENIGLPIFSVDNYKDVDQETWRPVPAPRPGDPAPERNPPKAEHGSRNARIFGEPGADAAWRQPVRGFLLIKCPRCGVVRPIYSREDKETYRCKECGSVTPLEREKMFPAYVNCQAGDCDQHQLRYMTNTSPEETEELTLNCLKCKTPIYLVPAKNGRAFVTRQRDAR